MSNPRIRLQRTRKPRQSTILDFEYAANTTVANLKTWLLAINPNLQNLRIYKSRGGLIEVGESGDQVLLADSTTLNTIYRTPEDFKWVVLHYSHN